LDRGEKLGHAIALENMARLQLELGKIDLSLKMYLESLQMSKELDDIEGVMACSEGLANVYINKKQYAQAKQYALTAYDIAHNMQAKSRIVNFSLTLVKIYEHLGEYPQALFYQKMYSVYKDSVYAEDKAKAISKTKALFQLEKKEAANELLTKEKQLQQATIEKQHTLLWTVAIGAILMLFFAWYMYRAAQIRKRINNKLAQANQVLEIQKEEIRAQAENLKEVNELLSQNYAQLEQQKEEIAVQAENLIDANAVISKKNHDITSSINAAQRIQQAILPSERKLKTVFSEVALFYRPRDIVSGDFYWYAQFKNWHLFAVADCTGHGVPGALMSMIGSQLLNDIVLHQGVTQPNEVLEMLDQGVRKSLKQDEGNNNEGMEIGLIAFDQQARKIHFAGAKRQLFYFDAQQHIQEIEPTKRAIGGKIFRQIPFESSSIDLTEGQTFYLFSDGIQDQFGGENGLKFSSKRLKNMLAEIHQLPLAAQQQMISNTMDQWMRIGNQRQIDDMLLVGFRCQ